MAVTFVRVSLSLSRNQLYENTHILSQIRTHNNVYTKKLHIKHPSTCVIPEYTWYVFTRFSWLSPCFYYSEMVGVSESHEFVYWRHSIVWRFLIWMIALDCLSSGTVYTKSTPILTIYSHTHNLLPYSQSTPILTIYSHAHNLLPCLQSTPILTIYSHTHNLLPYSQSTTMLTIYSHTYNLLPYSQSTPILTIYSHTHNLRPYLQSTTW